MLVIQCEEILRYMVISALSGFISTTTSLALPKSFKKTHYYFTRVKKST